VPRPLRVGIQLPEVEREVPWREYAAMARAAEASGFDSIWVGDHLLYRDEDRSERGPRDAWTLLAGLAAITQRVRLGPLVACTAFHPPGVLARMAATVDEVSAGRLVLGLGAGWNETEFRAFGLPFDQRASRFGEALEIVRRLLSGERVTLDGRFHRVQDAVILPRPSRRPPLMIGSMGRRVLEMTLPHVEVWNTWYDAFGNTPEGFASLNASVSEVAGRVGRAPDQIERSGCVLVQIGDEADGRDVDVPPLEGPAGRIAEGLRELAEAGADEAIVVATPITEGSIVALGEVLDLLEA
jgi:probable F420-dependent oxidoreductase